VEGNERKASLLPSVVLYPRQLSGTPGIGPQYYHKCGTTQGREGGGSAFFPGHMLFSSFVRERGGGECRNTAPKGTSYIPVTPL